MKQEEKKKIDNLPPDKYLDTTLQHTYTIVIVIMKKLIYIRNFKIIIFPIQLLFLRTPKKKKNKLAKE